MKGKRYSEEQIVYALGQASVNVKIKPSGFPTLFNLTTDSSDKLYFPKKSYVLPPFCVGAWARTATTPPLL